MDQQRRPPDAKQEQIADLGFPIYGIDQSMEFEQQRPETTPSALNVRGWEPSTQRDRGGSRQGLSKYIPSQLNPTVGNMLIQDLNVLVSTELAALLTGQSLDLSNTGGAISNPMIGLGIDWSIWWIPLYGSGIQLNQFVGSGQPIVLLPWVGGGTTTGGSGPTYTATLQGGGTVTVTSLSGTGRIPDGTSFIAIAAVSNTGGGYYFQLPTFTS